ncbi:serine protease Do 1 [Rhizobium gallicum]|uniref:Probable periplasmic serine endoprotease DegP-like n=1 Tax=Rhizobium gallicum TaxID=56730 RepID=A0A1L5NGE4_9HYPH|nr:MULTISPECIES: Do family serine endopeptidase [Rhizobium]APO66919.1 serine protease Do 1 [Rhizobium gallicum]QPB20714.1 Do family serine endopeptidase [Rhizobium sp. 007]ULJ70532.1 Do family serine endopeptidase [Rhizobium gallicum]WFU88307.1 Do family serine endopeptidase [Rhizobium sp. CC1099]
MFKTPSLKTMLKASTVAGLAAAVFATGVPLEITRSYAEAVNVQAPSVPSFANVVDAVSPAVVSVRVESRINPASDSTDGFAFDFNGRGFDDLPDDHPLKRFFRQFGEQGPNGPQGGPNRRFGPPDGKGRLRPVAQGSGFFISEDGYVVTNNHVVSDGSAFVAVMTDGTELDAKLIGRDPRTDLAVLKVDGKGRKFTYVNWADDNNVRVGDWVVAVGNPFGLGGTVTAGIISARGRDIGSGPYDDYLQVDAAVNRGNSGGPTFNLSGQVVGINTAIFSPSGGSVGIAFAIPASTAKDVVADLMKDGTVSRGYLGVQIQPVTKDIADSLGLSEANGALVVSAQDGTPGQKAGMKAGDVVTAVNGETVKDARDLSRRIGAMQPGSKVEVSVWRDGKAQSLTVELGTLPIDQKDASNDDNGGPAPQPEAPASEKALADLGLTVGPSDDGKGLTITGIDADSDAADKGIKQGEKITSVNNQQVSNADDVVKVLNQAKKDGRTRALFQIQSQEGSRFVALPINGQG